MASKPSPGMVAATAPDYPVTVMVDRDVADKFAMGDDISVVLSGKVRGITDHAYSSSVSNKIAIQIGSVSVSTTGLTPADSELKRMLDNV